jgi:hypothetical protein
MINDPCVPWMNVDLGSTIALLYCRVRALPSKQELGFEGAVIDAAAAQAGVDCGGFEDGMALQP